MSDHRAARALSHLDGASFLAGGLLATILALAAVSTVFGSGSIAGLGDPDVCLEVPAGRFLPFGGDEPRRARDGLLEAGVRESVASTRLCLPEPRAGVRVAADIRDVTPVVVVAGTLVLVRRWLRSAKQGGLFSPGVATRLRTVGRFMIYGALAVGLARLAGDFLVLRDALTSPPSIPWMGWMDTVPWLGLLVGIGVTSLARVLAYARLLEADVDGLV